AAPDRKMLLDKYCYWREEFTAWFYYQEALPPEIQEIVQIQESQVESAKGYSSFESNNTASPTPSDSMPSAPIPSLDVPSDPSDVLPAETAPDKASAVRVIKPQTNTAPEAIQQAIQEVKSTPLSLVCALEGATDKKTLATIAQQYIGELTGD